MRDIEDYAIIGILLIVADVIAAFLWWSLVNASDKRECRRAGNIVVETKGEEWHCAAPKAEAP